MNRLCKLAHKSKSFGEFKAIAVRQSGWYLRPYVEKGHNVNSPWIIEFWNSHKGGK